MFFFGYFEHIKIYKAINIDLDNTFINLSYFNYYLLKE